MPIDVLRSSVNQIIQHGRVIRPILGIAFAPEQSVEQVGQQPLSSVVTYKATYADRNSPLAGACF